MKKIITLIHQASNGTKFRISTQFGIGRDSDYDVYGGTSGKHRLNKKKAIQCVRKFYNNLSAFEETPEAYLTIDFYPNRYQPSAGHIELHLKTTLKTYGI